MKNKKKWMYLDFPKISDHRGNLTFIEGENHVPFEIKRVFYVYDIPSAESRGAHAHKKLEQVIICLSGGLQVELDNGKEKKEFNLNRPWRGLYIPPMTWTSTSNFNPGTVYIVLASDYYKESDYYRKYSIFKEALRRGS